MKILNALEAGFGIVDVIVKWFVGAALLVMTADLFLNSIARTFLNESFIGGPALGRLLVIWLCFLGSYLLVRNGGHVAIDIMSRAVSDRVWRWLSMVIAVIGAVTMGYVGWLGYLFTAKRFAYGQMDPMLEIPTGVFYLPLPIGGFLMSAAFLLAAVKAGIGQTERSAPTALTPIDEKE